MPGSACCGVNVACAAREHKFRDLRFKPRAVLGDAKIGARHRALRRRQRGAAGVFELLAGLQQRLMADHAQSAHFFDLVIGIGDDPVARNQLGRDLRRCS